MKSKFDPKFSKKVVSDYAINWKFSAPGSFEDTFVTAEDLSKTNTLIGKLDILVYLQPSNEFYLTVPAKPAAVFSYNVTMNRLYDDKDNNNNNNNVQTVQKSQYPYPPGGTGPIELTNFFGH